MFGKIACFLGLHSWNMVFQKSDSCKQIAVCKRCQRKGEHWVQHSWGEWKVNGPSQERVCERCGEMEIEAVYESTDGNSEGWSEEDLKAYGYPSNWFK